MSPEGMASPEQVAEGWGQRWLGVVVPSLYLELPAHKMEEHGRRLGLQLQAQAGVAQTRPLLLSLLPSGGCVETYRAMCVPNLHGLLEVPNQERSLLDI